jgi:shikimate dehydrogenase
MTRRKENVTTTADAAQDALARYGVVGNPVAHSKSPEIHRLFAKQTHQALTYERLEAPLDGFEDFALALRDAGYLGLNVTIPFKIEGDTIVGDNTDGIGFVRDISGRLRFKIVDAAILILGAGGGVRGLIGSLLDARPRWIAVANRTFGRAQELADEFGVEAIHFDEVPAEHFDLVINGTSSSLSHDAPPIDPETFDDCALAYDLVYARRPTPFMELAKRGGARGVEDGLGMLIEQAAESFHFWRGVRPDTAPVYKELRRLLESERTDTAAATR